MPPSTFLAAVKESVFWTTSLYRPTMAAPVIDGEDGGPPAGVVRAVLVRKDKGVQAHPDPGVGGRMSNGARQGDMEPNAMRSAAPLVMAALLMRDVRSIACILDLKA